MREGGRMKITKKDLRGLSAIQIRMALILCQVNGPESAREFIKDCAWRAASLEAPSLASGRSGQALRHHPVPPDTPD